MTKPEITLARAMIGLGAMTVSRAGDKPPEVQEQVVQTLISLLTQNGDLTPEQAGEAYYEEASAEYGAVDLMHGSTTTRVEFDGTVTHFMEESTEIVWKHPLNPAHNTFVQVTVWEFERLQSCEKAWQACFNALGDGNPIRGPGTGMECAVREIRRLQALANKVPF